MTKLHIRGLIVINWLNGITSDLEMEVYLHIKKLVKLDLSIIN